MNDYVDIIIVNYNTHDFLQQCIASIATHTDYPYKLTVIDNNSTDGSKSYLRQLERQGIPGLYSKMAAREKIGSYGHWLQGGGGLQGIQVILNNTNAGCAKAWNQGIAETTGKYLLFLNPDTLLSPHWLKEMVTCAESDPRIAVVGNKQTNQHGIILHAGLVEEEGRLHFRGAGEKDSPDKFTAVCDCIDVCGACYLVKRECFRQVGLFDERFFMYAEETDFSHRVRLAGLRVVYCPVTIVHFKDGAPITKSQRQRIHAKSCQLFDEKWKGGVV